jgi:hypothetical protein
MTVDEYYGLLDEFKMEYVSTDAYEDLTFKKSVCGYRITALDSAPTYNKQLGTWKANSMIMYEHGCWNGKYATTVEEGRKLLNEYFRNKKLKHVAEKKAEIILASKVFHI